MTRLVFRPRALKGLRDAPEEDRSRITTAIETLRRGSFPPQTKKLEGAKNGYRTRVGRWRIIFILKNGVVEIADIFLKKERGEYRRRT